MSEADSATKEKVEEIITVVKKDGLDEVCFEMVRDQSKLKTLCEDGVTAGLVQDVFTSFFTHDPKVTEESEPVQSGIVQQFMDLPEFKQVRASTEGDDLASAIGSLQFAPDLVVAYKRAKEEFEKQQKEAEEQGKPGPKNLKDALSDKDQTLLRQALRRGLESAQEQADKFQDMAKAWGVDKGELKEVPFAERFKMADQMLKSSKIKKIADLAGRFKNIVQSAAATVPVHGVDEIVDIGQGNDLGRLVPSELIKLIESPELFMMDYLEGKLMVYNMRGNEDLGQGPIIACLDISGSMEGQREEWSKAVVLSLMALAQKQKRSFGFIAFNTGIAEQKFWPKTKPASLKEKMAVASISSTGGTDFYAPLMGAFKMRMSDPTLRPADFIFITDGECGMQDSQQQQIKDLKAETNVRIYSIAINDGGYGETSGSTLKAFSDQIAVVNNLGDIDIVKNLVVKTASLERGKAQVKPAAKMVS